MSDWIVVVWLAGWLAATVFAAAVIGNVDNVRGSGDRSFPTFVVPLMFGWSWPFVVALALVVVPLAWLSDRTTRREDNA